MEDYLKDYEKVMAALGKRCGRAEYCSNNTLIRQGIHTKKDKRRTKRRKIGYKLVKKVKAGRTERRAKRAFRHIGIAVVHVTSFLKGRRSMADRLEKTGLPGQNGQ
jgi:hypothetical protein